MTVSNEELREILDAEEQERSAQFLKVWKIAVNMIGPALFRVTSPSVEAATDHRLLRPDMEAIRQHLLEKELPVHQFLFMVVSFYSFMEIEEVFVSADQIIPRIIDLQFLCDTERMIIYALVEHASVDDELYSVIK
jgi:hypothetical protein